MGSRPAHPTGSRGGSRRAPKRARKRRESAKQVLALPIRDAIEAQRRHVLRASAVVDMCRLASATKYAEAFDPEQLEEALDVVYALLDRVGEALEQFASSQGVSVGD